MPLPFNPVQLHSLTATALPSCTSHTLTATALPPCTSHTLTATALLPFTSQTLNDTALRTVPVTLWLEMSFDPVPGTL